MNLKDAYMLISRRFTMKFSATLPGVAIFGVLAAWMPLGILAALLHECGHILTALYLSVPVLEIGICGRGPFIRRRPASFRDHELAIASAGVVVNLLLALCFAGTQFATVNWILAVSNLIPCFGSDGQRILRLLSRKDTGLAVSLLPLTAPVLSPQYNP
jgi:Zn-dependent protease